MSLTAELKASFQAFRDGESSFSGGPYWSGQIDFIQHFATGLGANQANLVYVAERTVASGANDDIDLAGSLSDPLSAPFNAAELVLLLVINKQKDGTPNSTNLTIGGGTNPVIGFLGGTTPTIGPIRPGGIFALASPDAAGIGAVTAGTGDILCIANSAGAQAKYLIGVLARSA